MGGGFKRVFAGAAGVTNAVVDRAGAVVDTAAGLVTSAAVTAASKTPMLKNIVKLYVHRYKTAYLWVDFQKFKY